ncbi:unnamed protein product [Anisakis simplex]|uniref:Reverse transcriptase domain-containing protein n=1 Tax=Anisakis simplex TaxID=6269 RepID=A0A0M3KKM8_ANISI|nr:unnamed protein product [Anisakis simplex]
MKKILPSKYHLYMKEGNNLANGTTLGPLQIDVGVAGALADSLNGDRRRHRTDPGIITQRISTYLHRSISILFHSEVHQFIVLFFQTIMLDIIMIISLTIRHIHCLLLDWMNES